MNRLNGLYVAHHCVWDEQETVKRRVVEGLHLLFLVSHGAVRFYILVFHVRLVEIFQFKVLFVVI